MNNRERGRRSGEVSPNNFRPTEVRTISEVAITFSHDGRDYELVASTKRDEGDFEADGYKSLVFKLVNSYGKKDVLFEVHAPNVVKNKSEIYSDKSDSRFEAALQNNFVAIFKAIESEDTVALAQILG